MGLFENLGRKVEEFKQQAQEASEDEAAFECEDCGATLYSEHEACPECGSENLVRRSDGDADETQ